MHAKPLVMLDPLGHYDGLLAWLRGLVDTGFVGAGAMERLIVVADVDAALDACAPQA
jgi:predicted Rossmann-fold nucleotide-binding protein